MGLCNSKEMIVDSKYNPNQPIEPHPVRVNSSFGDTDRLISNSSQDALSSNTESNRFVYKVEQLNEKLRPIRKGYLKITKFDLVFSQHPQSSDIYLSWLLTTVRWYAYTRDHFIFQCGRKATTGEGTFIFSCDDIKLLKENFERLLEENFNYYRNYRYSNLTLSNNNNSNNDNSDKIAHLMNNNQINTLPHRLSFNKSSRIPSNSQFNRQYNRSQSVNPSCDHSCLERYSKFLEFSSANIEDDSCNNRTNHYRSDQTPSCLRPPRLIPRQNSTSSNNSINGRIPFTSPCQHSSLGNILMEEEPAHLLRTSSTNNANRRMSNNSDGIREDEAIPHQFGSSQDVNTEITPPNQNNEHQRLANDNRDRPITSSLIGGGGNYLNSVIVDSNNNLVMNNHHNINTVNVPSGPEYLIATKFHGYVNENATNVYNNDDNALQADVATSANSNMPTINYLNIANY